MTEFFVVLAVIALILGLHPYFFYPMTLRAWRAAFGVRPLRYVAPDHPASCSIVCAARNEARVIESKIDNLSDVIAAHPAHRFQVFVYSDGSTDGTAAVLERNQHRITPVISEEWRGKSFGMNEMLALSNTDIVLFTDANVRVDPAGLAAMFKSFADPEVGCVCGHLIYENGKESATAKVGARYWAFEEELKRLETDTGSVIGADGGLFAIRRSLWRPVPLDIIDDFHTSLSVLCDGHRVVRNPDFIAYERAAVRSDEEFRRKVRIACRAFNCHRALWPRLRRLPALDLYKYVSHRLLRWLSGLNLVASALFLILAALTAGYLALAGAGLVALCATGLMIRHMSRSRGGNSVTNILVALAGAAVGVVRSLSGERFQTWAAAASARAPLPSASNTELPKHIKAETARENV